MTVTSSVIISLLVERGESDLQSIILDMQLLEVNAV